MRDEADKKTEIAVIQCVSFINALGFGFWQSSGGAGVFCYVTTGVTLMIINDFLRK